MVRRAYAAAILIGIAAVSAPSSAQDDLEQFRRSTVDGDPSKELFWRYRWVTIQPAYETCEDVSVDGVRLAIARSIATWNTAAQACSDFALFDGGPPSGLATNLDGGEPDMENRVRWRQEGEWPDDPETLALTTIVYRTASGQIVDADIDLNGDIHYWSDTSTPGDIYIDVENTMTHELGHLLGLAHVNRLDATMYYESGNGDIEKRDLSDGDIEGLCFIYPRGQLTPGAPDFQAMPLTGCSASAARGPWWIGLLIAWGWRARAARRRARRRGTAS